MFSLYSILSISISVLGTLPIKWYYSTVRPGCLTYCQSHLKGNYSGCLSSCFLTACGSSQGFCVSCPRRREVLKSHSNCTLLSKRHIME